MDERVGHGVTQREAKEVAKEQARIAFHEMMADLGFATQGEGRMQTILNNAYLDRTRKVAESPEGIAREAAMVEMTKSWLNEEQREIRETNTKDHRRSVKWRDSRANIITGVIGAAVTGAVIFIFLHAPQFMKIIFP